MVAILPLLGRAHQVHNVSMFAVYCPAHRSRILLFSDNIRALVNGPTGAELHWRCTCGAEGVKRVHRVENHWRSSGDGTTTGALPGPHDDEGRASWSAPC